MTRVASLRYLRNAFSTEARSSSNALKYFRWVASFLVFFHSFSIGLNCGENLGQAMDRQALGVRLTELLDHLAAIYDAPSSIRIIDAVILSSNWRKNAS
jgi:hypothetical protein